MNFMQTFFNFMFCNFPFSLRQHESFLKEQHESEYNGKKLFAIKKYKATSRISSSASTRSRRSTRRRRRSTSIATWAATCISRIRRRASPQGIRLVSHDHERQGELAFSNQTNSFLFSRINQEHKRLFQ